MSTMLLDRAAQGTRSPDQPTATEMSPTCRLLPKSRLLNSRTCQPGKAPQRLLMLLAFQLYAHIHYSLSKHLYPFSTYL